MYSYINSGVKGLMNIFPNWIRALMLALVVIGDSQSSLAERKCCLCYIQTVSRPRLLLWNLQSLGVGQVMSTFFLPPLCMLVTKRGICHKKMKDSLSAALPLPTQITP